MTYEQFLDRIIDDACAAARKDYVRRTDKMAGAIDGLEACRGKDPAALRALLEAARAETLASRQAQMDDYWTVRTYEAEVEWVCNCVSAVVWLHADRPPPGFGRIVVPTVRAARKAAQVLGIRTGELDDHDSALT